MTELTTFHYHDAAVRMQQTDDGEPLFCASDVCGALGYLNPRKALADHVYEDDVTKRYTIDTLGRQQESNFVNESGLYALIFGSKLEGAKDFKRWVTSEVLPAIRKTGRYEVASSGSKMPMDELQGFLGVIKTVLEPAGIVGNQLTLALDKAVKAETGKSALALTGVQLEAPTQTHLLTPTDLGKSLGLSAVAVNKKLAAMGYQTKTDNGWELTAKGIEAGGVFLDTNKRHSNGTPIRQLKWPANIASQLSA